jgi:hypothetical protein
MLLHIFKLLVQQVIENAVFAFRQPPSLVRHVATTVIIVALTVVISMATDCVGLVVQLNVNNIFFFRSFVVYSNWLK